MTEQFVNRIIEISDGDGFMPVVERFVELKKAGSQYTACCPSHDEKTPSFSVSPAKSAFHCFGCGFRGRGAIDFLIKLQGLEFIPAVKEVANILSIPLEFEEQAEQSAEQKRHANRIREAKKTMTQGVDQYCKNLVEYPEAMTFCMSRGLTPEDVRRFKIGYCPRGGANLMRLVGENRLQSLIDSGLIAVTEKGTKYEPFFDRITFPVLDENGNAIGITARTMQAKDPSSTQPYRKYVNSNNNLIFDKKNVLYGIYQCLQADSPEKGVVNVIEGAVDVIASHRHGFTNTVATLGTAFNLNHFSKLRRRFEHIRFVMDGDAAGVRSMLSTLKTVAPYLDDRITCSFAILPPDDDPDSLLSKPSGSKIFNQILNQSLSLDRFLVETLLQANGGAVNGLTQTIKECREVIESIQYEPLKIALITTISKALGVSDEHFLTIATNQSPSSTATPTGTTTNAVSTASTPLQPKSEVGINICKSLSQSELVQLHVLLNNPEFIEIAQLDDAISNPKTQVLRVANLILVRGRDDIRNDIAPFLGALREKLKGYTDSQIALTMIRDARNALQDVEVSASRSRVTSGSSPQ